MLLKTTCSRYRIKAYGGLMLLLALSVSVYAQNPQADFTHSVNWSAPLIISFTDLSTPTGSITGWTWDFGDATPTSNVQSPSHTYAFNGEYLVSLTVNQGSYQNTVFRTVSVSSTLKAVFTKSASIGAPGMEVKLDGRASTGYVTGLSWIIAPGSGVTYSIGSSTSPTATVKFAIAGTYDISLFVSSSATTNVSAKQTVTVTNAPYADFSWPTPVYENQPVQFTNDSRYPCPSGSSYVWTFDNYITRTDENAFYTFTTAGSHSVKLCVTDGCGTTGCVTKTVSVISAAGLLTAKFGTSPGFTTIKKGGTIDFVDQSTPRTSIGAWFWNWETPPETSANGYDIGTANLFYTSYAGHEQISHTFNNRGVFRTYLQVAVNTATAGSFASKIIKVQETPVLTSQSGGGQTLSDNVAAYRSGYQVEIHKKPAGYQLVNWPISATIPGGSTLGWPSIINFNYVYFPAAKLKNDDLMVQYKVDDNNLSGTYYYQMFPDIDTRSGVIEDHPLDMNWTTGYTIAYAPKFDFFNDEAAVVEVAYNTVYLYLRKRGVNPTNGNSPCWRGSPCTGGSMTKTTVKTLPVGSQSVVDKVYLDDRGVVMMIDGDAIIYEKIGGVWNLTTQKKITGPFKGIAYKGNVIMTTPVNCWTGSYPFVADIRERQPSGWVNDQAPSASLRIDDSEITSTTTTCSVYPESLEISDKIASVAVRLTTNGNGVDRRFIFKKKDDFWSNSNQVYKVNAGSLFLSETTDTDGLNGGNIINYVNYCMQTSYVQQSFSISGAQYDVAEGIIELGGGASAAQFNSGAKAKYLGRSITLKPGVWVKPGAQVTFTGVASCDDLYYR